MGILCLRLDGDFDFSKEREVRSLLQAPKELPRHIIIDLTDVSFIDSSILASIIRFKNDLMRRFGRANIAVVAPNGLVRRIFDVTGARALFEMHESYHAAVAAANGDGHIECRSLTAPPLETLIQNGTGETMIRSVSS